MDTKELEQKAQPCEGEDGGSAFGVGVYKDLSHLSTTREPTAVHNRSQEENERLNRKLVRKMDLIILPTIGILYILNYIDRQNLSAAKLQGIMEDLHMNEQQFATAIAILFAGYLPFQIPSNLIISRIPRPGLYICTAAAIWGAISAATSAVQTYGQLLAGEYADGCRVLLDEWCC